jgi:hypothetical protein
MWNQLEIDRPIAGFAIPPELPPEFNRGERAFLAVAEGRSGFQQIVLRRDHDLLVLSVILTSPSETDPESLRIGSAAPPQWRRCAGRVDPKYIRAYRPACPVRRRRPRRRRIDTAAGSPSVAEIGSQHSISAIFAYLSACETSLTTEALADEAIHLTAAFQLLGHRSVVGTQWAVNDRVAARASREFYRALGTGTDTALAMHSTVRALQQRYPKRPSAWAAYQHVGA